MYGIDYTNDPRAVLIHFNPNHDELCQFAKSPSGSSSKKKLDSSERQEYNKGEDTVEKGTAIIEQILSQSGTKTVSELASEKDEQIEHPQSAPKSVSFTTSNGIKVTEISGHAMDQATVHDVDISDIESAVMEPLHVSDVVIDDNGRPSQRFIGANATVNVNPDTGVVSTLWKTGRRYRRKYTKEE